MRRPADPHRNAQRDWASRKYRILEQYFAAAFPRRGAGAGAGNIVIYDGFAGRGEDSPGRLNSPLLLACLADHCAELEHPVRVRIFLSEARKKAYEELSEMLRQWVEREVVTLLQGSVVDHRDQVLAAAQGCPLFLCLDPLKPNDLPFQALHPFLEREEPTEALIVFFAAAISRVLATLLPGSKTLPKIQEENVRALDEMFGGDAWRGLLSRPEADSTIVRTYTEALRPLLPPGSSVLPHAIEAGYGEVLKYHLIFHTRHRDGLLLMNDAFYKERVASYQSQGQLQLQSMFLADSHTPTVELERSEQERRAELQLLAVARDARSLLARGELIHRCMVAHFGEFSETEWRRGVKRLVSRTSGPRLEAPGALRGKGGALQLNDVVRLRYAE